MLKFSSAWQAGASDLSEGQRVPGQLRTGPRKAVSVQEARTRRPGTWAFVWARLPSARPAAAIKMSIAPHRPRPPPSPREGGGRTVVLSFPGLSMSPLGSLFDAGSGKPCGAERPALNRRLGGTPTDPRFPEAYRSEGKRKHCVCSSANVDGFIHRPPPAPPPACSPSLFSLTRALPSAALISSAQRPGDEKADR